MLKKGSKATLTIPPHLAYGDLKVGIIPPDSTLIFDMGIEDCYLPKRNVRQLSFTDGFWEGINDYTAYDHEDNHRGDCTLPDGA